MKKFITTIIVTIILTTTNTSTELQTLNINTQEYNSFKINIETDILNDDNLVDPSPLSIK